MKLAVQAPAVPPRAAKKPSPLASFVEAGNEVVSNVAPISPTSSIEASNENSNQEPPAESLSVVQQPPTKLNKPRIKFIQKY